MTILSQISKFLIHSKFLSLPPPSLPPPASPTPASVLEHPLVSYPLASCPPALVPPRKDVNSECTNYEKMKAKIEEYEQEMAVF